jgi:rod shape-determining protein MreC
MASGADRSLSRGDTVRFLLCVGLSVGALFAPQPWGDRVAAAIRQTVLVPFLWLQERAEEAKTGRSVVSRVTAERDSAAFAAQFLPALRSENQRLRQLLALGERLEAPYVAAEVLHQSVPTDARALLLGVGRRDGVSVFDPVVAPEGLLGVVRSVGEDHSVAMTWSHPEFRVSAFAEGGTVFGIVGPAGESTAGEQLLQLRGVAYRDTIPIGTAVYSSGLGGVFPQGIPIGTVIGLGREETGWERAYLLRPAANPAMATHVLILRAPHKPNVSGGFTGDSIP